MKQSKSHLLKVSSAALVICIGTGGVSSCNLEDTEDHGMKSFTEG